MMARGRAMGHRDRVCRNAPMGRGRVTGCDRVMGATASGTAAMMAAATVSAATVSTPMTSAVPSLGKGRGS
jgi:hypothetical protein